MPELFIDKISFCEDILPITISTPVVIPKGRAYDVTDGTRIPRILNVSTMFNFPEASQLMISRMAFPASSRATNRTTDELHDISVSVSTYFLYSFTN
jgi:hypothetical protein